MILPLLNSPLPRLFASLGDRASFASVHKQISTVQYSVINAEFAKEPELLIECVRRATCATYAALAVGMQDKH